MYVEDTHRKYIEEGMHTDKENIRGKEIYPERGYKNTKRAYTQRRTRLGRWKGKGLDMEKYRNIWRRDNENWRSGTATTRAVQVLSGKKKKHLGALICSPAPQKIG